ncbi:MFS transporter [Lysinibacillus cavernae]|uniref:MFS transporter n=1 Tax=Lysinibacillus cavernae TaxID=2666135 RepID=UPI0012D85561|nr:MFS transporter [Lysinibacillus cavernae]
MKWKDIHPNVKLRLAMQFLGSLITMAVIPFLAIYFSQKIGATQTGIILIIIVVSGVIGGIIGGHVSDRIGRKKIMIYSELGLLLSYLFITLCNSPWFDSPYFSAGFFIINMFCGGMFQPAAQAMIIDITNPDSRKFVFTISYWLGNLATAIGGIIGAFLFKNYLFELFIGITLISLLSVWITIFFITETYIPKPSTKAPNHQQNFALKEMFNSFSIVLKDKLFMFYIMGGILIFSLEQSLTNYIGIRLEKDIPHQSASFFTIDFMLDGTKMLGFLRTENTILVVLLSSVILFVFRKWSDRWTLATGMLIFSICFSIFAVTNNVLILFIAMFIGTIGELMYVPIKQAMLGEIAPPNARSTYMAFNSMTLYGAMVISSLLTIIGEWIPPIYMGGLLLILGLTGTFLYFIVTKKLYSKASEENESKVPVSY